MESISNTIDKIILNAIEQYDNSYSCSNSFEKLINFGELVDRLSIINFKLYRLKDAVMDRSDDEKFRAWASIEDVKLVKERSKLKKCIDEKLVVMIQRVLSNDTKNLFSTESKQYGSIKD